MPIPLIPIAMGLIEFAPAIARWLGGDKAGEVAEKTVDVARRVTGIDGPENAVEAIAKDPKLQIEFQRAIAPVVIAELEAETRQLEAVNATMRAEAASGDPFVRRWRPFFGYVVALAWLTQMAAISAVVVMEPAAAPQVISAMASLSVIWGVALSVLGVSVASRSRDKQVAAGRAPPAGVLAAIAARIAGKGE